MIRNWAMHEVLETNELLRKLTADIELHAMCASMTNDQDLKNTLQRHIQVMDGTYNQAINMLQNKGMNVPNKGNLHIHVQHQPHIGLQNPQMIPAPNTNTNSSRLSEATIGTLILNMHKAGAMFGMQWASECVDPDVRSLHVMAANNCQQMAYEIFQLMNARGYYEVPSMSANEVNTLAHIFQPMTNINVGQTGTNHYM